MALQLNDATAIINRVINIVQGNSDWAFCVWVQVATVSTAPDYISHVAVTDAGYTAWDGIFSNASVSAGQTQVNASNGATPQGSTNFTVAAGRRYHLGLRRSGTSHLFYVNGFLIGSITENMTAVTLTELLLGNDRFSVVPGAIQYWDYAEWNDDKSVNTIRRQMTSFGVPSSLDLTNLICFTPLVSDLLDDSGNGNDWSATGNYEFVANPSLPTNVTIATAETIASLPFNDVIADCYNLPLVYKYTAVAEEKYIGAFGYGTASGYKPILDVVPASDLNYHWPNDIAAIGIANKAVQFPVIPGDTYYLIYNVSAQGNPAPFELDAYTAPRLSVPEGSTIINDDSLGFGTVFLDESDGSVLQFQNPSFPSGFANPIFPAGEAGENLVYGDGTICFIDDYAALTDPQIYLYEQDLTMIGVFSPPLHNVKDVISDCCQSRFYLLFNPGGSNPYYLEMDVAGSINPTTIGPVNATSTNIRGSAVNRLRTKLFYQVLLTATSSVVRVWDLISNLALSDLVAGPVNHAHGNADVLCTFDDCVIVAWLTNSSYLYRKYDESGTLQWTLDLSSSLPKGSTIDRMALHPNGTHFRIFFHKLLGFSKFIDVNISTGAISATADDVVQYEGGVYQPAETPTPLADFGHPFSCPMLISSAEDIEPPEPENLVSGIYEMIKGKTNDTIWTDVDLGTTEDVKIP